VPSGKRRDGASLGNECLAGVTIASQFWKFQCHLKRTGGPDVGVCRACYGSLAERPLHGIVVDEITVDNREPGLR
jgi:hypothetical protein